MGTALVDSFKQRLPEKHRRVASVAEQMHLVAFLSFVLSVMCWLIDNYFCKALWQLPGGLPYPHLHTWWHLFVTVTLYIMLICLHVDDKRAVEVHFRLGFFPVV